jgi:hypothetical protein
MTTLTAAAAIEFADDLATIVLAISNLHKKNSTYWELLTSQQKDYLLNCQIQLMRSSALFYAKAITLNAEKIKNQLDGLRAASKTIDDSLNSIKDAQKVIDIAGLALNVASSVASGNVLTVSESLGKLLQNISGT